MNRIVLILMVMLWSIQALSSEMVYQTNVNVKRLGSHSGNVFYLSLEEGFTKDCKWGLAYCIDSESCTSMLSIALSAKAMGKKLVDFRYNYEEATGYCKVWLVATE